MKCLETLLTARKKSREKSHETAIHPFDHLKNRIRCYAHIINLCSLHVISSFSSACYDLNSTIDDYGDDDEDNNTDFDIKFADPTLGKHYDDEAKEWAQGLKREPLTRCQRIVRLFRSSNEHRTGFQKIIERGNKHGWWTKRVNDKVVVVNLPQLQLLRDVKTRWDSVYMMLQRLREL